MKTILEVKGGLGNQLFQLAAGIRRVGDKFDSLYLNTNYYSIDARHGGCLLEILFAPFKFNYTDKRQFTGGNGILNFDLLPSYNAKFISHIDCPLYIAGYFQNYDFIEPTLPIMASMITNSTSWKNCRESFEREFPVTRPQGSGEAVINIGVHVRRGDYLTPENRAVHGLVRICDIQNVVDLEVKNASDPSKVRIIVFSDDKATELLPRNDVKYQTKHTTDKTIISVDEFCAMMMCDVLICSNSTYGYWAGILSNKIRRLYLPAKWMKSNLIRTEDLLPMKIGNVYNNELD
jgi:hypothetical protein